MSKEAQIDAAMDAVESLADRVIKEEMEYASDRIVYEVNRILRTHAAQAMNRIGQAYRDAGETFDTETRLHVIGGLFDAYGDAWTAASRSIGIQAA